MSTREHAPLAELASTDAHYERYGLARERVEPFEDGARTDGRAGTYEWWYFHAHLDDGAKLVVFIDKDLASSQKPLAPLIRPNLGGAWVDTVTAREPSPAGGAKAW